MKLKISRDHLQPTYTIGSLYIDHEQGQGWEYFCDTLEDVVRDLEHEKKVYGKTSIPYGEYKVIINHSNRFNRDMPLLLDVPQFEGIRIHAGNTDADTDGCILLGYNKEKGMVTNSIKTFTKFFDLLKSSNQKQWTLQIT